MGQTQTIGRCATTVSRSEDQTLRVTYHSTDVVTVHPDGSITLNTGGWKTATTKSRMNQASNQLGLGYRVFQKDFDWFVDYRGRCFDFDDISLDLPSLTPEGANRNDRERN